MTWMMGGKEGKRIKVSESFGEWKKVKPRSGFLTLSLVRGRAVTMKTMHIQWKMSKKEFVELRSWELLRDNWELVI